MTTCIQQLSIKPSIIRRYVEDNFSIGKMVQGYLGVYRDALMNHNGRQVA